MGRDTFSIEEIKAIKPPPVGGYTVTVNSHIHKRLERHILIIKKLIDRHATKQDWLVNAIREKMEKDITGQEIPTTHSITVKLDARLEQMILQRIEYIKKFKFSYSKKKWIIDAIVDKLDRDEEEVEKKLLNTKQDLILTERQQIELLKNEVAELKARLNKN